MCEKYMSLLYFFTFSILIRVLEQEYVCGRILSLIDKEISHMRVWQKQYNVSRRDELRDSWYRDASWYGVITRRIIQSVREQTYERDQRNELSEDREPLCVHSVGNEAGEHSWWYLSFLGALATRLADSNSLRKTAASDRHNLDQKSHYILNDCKILFDRWPPFFQISRETKST